MVYLPGNTAAWATVNYQKRRLSRLSEDEIAEFLTKTERKCKNTQNISLVDGFEEYVQERASSETVLRNKPKF